jgi:hypothetical protein
LEVAEAEGFAVGSDLQGPGVKALAELAAGEPGDTLK